MGGTGDPVRGTLRKPHSFTRTNTIVVKNFVYALKPPTSKTIEHYRREGQKMAGILILSPRKAP